MRICYCVGVSIGRHLSVSLCFFSLYLCARVCLFQFPAQHLAFALFAVGGAVDLLTLPDAAAHLERFEGGGE